jgi:hypothetical protein
MDAMMEADYEQDVTECWRCEDYRAPGSSTHSTREQAEAVLVPMRSIAAGC